MTFRMLRKDGTGSPFPWNEILAQKDGMVECQMTKEQIDKACGREKPIRHHMDKMHTTKDQKPGAGWRKVRGEWVRGIPRRRKNSKRAILERQLAQVA
ncbi:MAG: hypothetical protein WC332_00495 [Clostridia bacterium]|jgi:hypothetical protein